MGAILGLHVTLKKIKMKNSEFLPISGKRHLNDISAGLFSAR